MTVVTVAMVVAGRSRRLRTPPRVRKFSMRAILLLYLGGNPARNGARRTKPRPKPFAAAPARRDRRAMVPALRRLGVRAG
jgi:hypothetical protein